MCVRTRKKNINRKVRSGRREGKTDMENFIWPHICSKDV